MGFLSGVSSFVEEHSDSIQGVMDVAGNIPCEGNVSDRANTTIDTAKGNADSDVVSSISCIGDTMALASESAKVEKETKDKSALSKAKGMNSMLGGVRGKAKTGAKTAGSGENLKTPSKKKRIKNKCFTGDTPVFTSCGYRLIKEIQKGDDIYSRNAKTGETGVQEVEEVFCTETHTVYHIWLDGKEEIKTTAYHPIYVQEQGWVSAINLREGDVVETMDGAAQVTKIVKVRHEEKVQTYNLHVKEWASYFVGKIRVFVHNGRGKHGKGTPDKENPDEGTEVIWPDKPHTNNTEGHWETIQEEVNRMEESGEYSKIYVNKGLSNEIPSAKPNRRPDIMAVRKDGLIDQVEVPSKSDSPVKLIDRMTDSQRILGDRAGTIRIKEIGGG